MNLSARDTVKHLPN